MDPNQPQPGTTPPTNQPPVPPAPTPGPVPGPIPGPLPTPPPAPMGMPPQPMPMMSANSSAKSSKLPFIIAGIVVVLLLVIGGVVFALTSNNKKSNSSTDKDSNSSSISEESDDSDKADSASEEDTTPAPTGNAKTATYSSDFSDVCDGDTITNAGDLGAKSSAKMASFVKHADRSYYTSLSAGYGEAYYADSKTPISSISIVACLNAIKGSDAKLMTCQYKKDDTPVSVDLYSSRYSVTYLNAKTGKKIAQGNELSSTASSCPYFVSYDPTTMKAYASLDDNAVKTEFSRFIAN